MTIFLILAIVFSVLTLFRPILFIIPAIVFWILFFATRKKTSKKYSANSNFENEITDFPTQNEIISSSLPSNQKIQSLEKTIVIPADMRKKTTLAGVLYYDKIEIFDNKVTGYRDNKPAITWYFRNYSGVDFVKASINSQFAQIVFLTGMNSKNRAIGLDFYATQNANAIKDTNRILICSGLYSFGYTNNFAEKIADSIREVFDRYNDSKDEVAPPVTVSISAADEIKKYKDLLDSGTITQEEFDAKKKQLLGL